MDICRNTDEVIKALFQLEHFLSQREKIEVDRGFTSPIYGYDVVDIRFSRNNIFVEAAFRDKSRTHNSQGPVIGNVRFVISNSKVFTEKEWSRHNIRIASIENY